MKKSQLKKIIIEELKKLQKEGKEHLTGTHIKGDPNANLCQCDDGVKYINCGRECECCDQVSATDGRFKGKPHNIKEQGGGLHGVGTLQPATAVAAAANPTQLFQDFSEWTITSGYNFDWKGCKLVFPQIRSWMISIFSLPVFAPTAPPSQPCQFICNKIDQLTTQMSTTNPNGPWYPRLECKLRFFEGLQQMLGCTC
jgi:hypothetical protein